jgi:hypothetical protein
MKYVMILLIGGVFGIFMGGQYEEDTGGHIHKAGEMQHTIQNTTTHSLKNSDSYALAPPPIIARVHSKPTQCNLQFFC